jgi:hypothetical protein
MDEQPIARQMKLGDAYMPWVGFKPTILVFERAKI